MSKSPVSSRQLRLTSALCESDHQCSFNLHSITIILLPSYFLFFCCLCCLQHYSHPDPTYYRPFVSATSHFSTPLTPIHSILLAEFWARLRSRIDQPTLNSSTPPSYPTWPSCHHMTLCCIILCGATELLRIRRDDDGDNNNSNISEMDALSGCPIILALSKGAFTLLRALASASTFINRGPASSPSSLSFFAFSLEVQYIRPITGESQNSPFPTL